VVKKLATEIGFDTVDAGPLINARVLEYLALLWIHLAYSQQMGPNIAFKLLTRPGGM
jgi:predicted dinucleotide-binding enzyme